MTFGCPYVDARKLWSLAKISNFRKSQTLCHFLCKIFHCRQFFHPLRLKPHFSSFDFFWGRKKWGAQSCPEMFSLWTDVFSLLLLNATIAGQYSTQRVFDLTFLIIQTHSHVDAHFKRNECLDRLERKDQISPFESFNPLERNVVKPRRELFRLAFHDAWRLNHPLNVLHFNNLGFEALSFL